jgi:tetratricopeptide (TPR) repeat protein
MMARKMRSTPREWDQRAHELWLSGRKKEAVQAAAQRLKTFGKQRPPAVALQLAYYLFLQNDYRTVATLLEEQIAITPRHVEVLLNLAVVYARLGRHDDAARRANDVLELDAGNAVALDVLSKSLPRLGRYDEAAVAGERALELKDKNCAPASITWRLPDGNAHDFAHRDGKRDIISFSLWGSHPRYLRGALHNAILAPRLFADWVLRFYVDSSVPAELGEALGSLGAEVVVQAGTHTLREKLCWRFLVANDSGVGRFLVRDVDSVFSEREAAAVAEWLASDRWFHVMRDWWTHTDPVLAGMWGGVAGVLPELAPLLAEYAPKTVETSNVDQWFLRDRIWSYLRQSCLVHDRCFRVPGSRSFPGPQPQGTFHVGQDEYAVRRAEQATLLIDWIDKLPCLREAKPSAG